MIILFGALSVCFIVLIAVADFQLDDALSDLEDHQAGAGKVKL